MLTFDQSASSSSAIISGNEVMDPCPISVAGDMIVMVPSVEMLTHGLIALPVRSAASTAATARPLAPSATANERPVAPIITSRRETTRRPDGYALMLSIECCVMDSGLPGGALDRAHNALIGS